MKDFIVFMQAEIAKLRDFSDIETVDIHNVAIVFHQVQSRKLAIECLERILAPVVNTQSTVSGYNPQDFVA